MCFEESDERAADATPAMGGQDRDTPDIEVVGSPTVARGADRLLADPGEYAAAACEGIRHIGDRLGMCAGWRIEDTAIFRERLMHDPMDEVRVIHHGECDAHRHPSRDADAPGQ